jgi:hypothetical protein
MRGLHSSAASESSDGMEDHRAGYVFFAQIVKNLQIERLVVPLVRFNQIESDLDGHARILQQAGQCHACQHGG